MTAPYLIPSACDKPLNILILGCGYLGGRLAAMATQHGHTVCALTRNPESAAQLRALGLAQVVEGQLQGDDWHSAFAAPHYDLVVNCVSSGGYGMDGYRLSYVEGMQSIFRWARLGRSVAHFIYTGATSVYPQDNGELVTEADVPTHLTESGTVLLEAEQLVRDNAALFDRATVLRLGGIYGPTRHYLLKLLRQGQRQFPGRDDFVINHIHVDDAIGAISAAFAKAQPGFSLYNVVDGSFPTKRELVCTLATELGIDPAGITFDPEDVTARAARRQVPGAVQGGMPNRRVSNALILKELGWKPQYPSFREGYRALLVAGE